MWANGVRYLRVGGRRKHHFVGPNLKPRKLFENAATPTRRVHAVLGKFVPTRAIVEKDTATNAHKFYTPIDLL